MKKIKQKQHKPYPASKLVPEDIYLDILLGKVSDMSEDDIWVTVEGEHIFIKNLRESHIKNILLFMDKRPGWRAEQRHKLVAELDRRNKLRLIKKTPTGALIYGFND